MPRPVSKRATLPGASELFRPTRPAPEIPDPRADVPAQAPAEVPAQPAPAKEKPASKPRKRKTEPPAATGRVKHDQKITVYFSSEELFALEDATLELKRHHGLSLDRGRVVRTAVALALADLADGGADSAIVAALREQ